MTDTAAEYWSRPYKVRIDTSHFSGTFCFHTAREAFDYLFQSYANVERIIRNREYGSSWVAFDCERSRIETPQGTFQAAYVLNVYELRSH